MTEETWQPARLIPISGLGGQQEKERRAVSALLAVLTAVKEFNRAMLGMLGAPAANVEAFCEVPFVLGDGRHVRVDGIIRVQRGKRTWTLVVEAKTGTAELTQHQVEDYLEVVRREGFNGLLTISNQIVQSVEQHPVHVDKRRFGRLSLFHVSWQRILSIAHTVNEHQGVSDPDQAWILGELIRYLEYEGSGALTFDDMGPHWVATRTAIRDETIRLSDEGVNDIAARWDQLIQFLSLRLGARLGQEVRPVLTRKEVEEADLRTAALARALVETGVLMSAIRIPNTVGPIQLTANLRRMTATAAVEVGAPDLKRSTSRVNWLLRQLRAAPSDTRIDVAFYRTRSTSSELLQAVLDDPSVLLTEPGRMPKSFVLALSTSVGANRRRGKRSFISDVSSLLDRFYRDVVQDLKQWAPPAPQLAPERRSENGPEVASDDDEPEPPPPP